MNSSVTPEPSTGDSACCLRPDPARVIVPRKHGVILVEPPMPVLRKALSQGPCRPRPLPSPEILLGVSREDLRAKARADLLTAMQRHAALTDTSPPLPAMLARPWVITGHQVEFYHAGVWAKAVAADALARSAGAAAIDLLVDHDVVDHLGFDMPARLPDGTWERRKIQWAAPAPVPADSLSPPSPADFLAWDAALAQHPTAHSDALAFVLSHLHPEAFRAIAGLPQSSPTADAPPPAPQFAAWMSRARSLLETALGVNIHHVTTSAMCESATFGLFVLAWIAHAEAWTAAYNRHLAAYRRAHDIHNDHHPMPDLHRDATGGAAFELPFWIYTPGEPRARLIVRRDPGTGRHEIHHGFDVFRLPDIADISGDTALGIARSFLNALADRRLRIRPRALTLTMFVRLFLSDLFIHGIGGALYDQITNGLLEELFGEAPSYACVSAAWLLPLGQPLEADAEVSTLRHQRHHLQHNPQIAIDPFTALKTDIAELIMQRRTLVTQIAASSAAPTRPARRAGRAQRLAWFRELHATNEALHAKVPHILKKLDTQIAAAKLAAEQNKVLLWREYYFALHTLESLRSLIHKVRSM